MSETNPLTARVTVNRYWAELWGHGIVPSLGNFGTQVFESTLDPAPSVFAARGRYFAEPAN